MFLKIYPQNPNPRYINLVKECINDGGIVIYPTDTIYGLGCGLNHSKAVQKIAQIKNTQVEKADFSIICYDLSNISEFTKPISNNVFKTMKANLPGPFTFILNANSNVPALFKSKKKTVGIRVPDNNIVRELVNALGEPLVTTSIKDEDEIIEYMTDPELIYEKYCDLVDIVIDGGYGDNQPSTVVDCTQDEPIIIRQGKGILR